MQNKTEYLQSECFYHIYNRGNGSEFVFKSDENYIFFLKKYNQYISPICNTYCYCLMPNHFHFLIEVKSFKELNVLFNTSEIDMPALISKQFSDFFNAYSKAFNKQQGRKGSLFMRPFKRKKIVTKEYLLKLIHYIHYNPVESELCRMPAQWKYSSYSSLLSTSKTVLQRETVISWFETKENFRFVHDKLPEEISFSF